MLKIQEDESITGQVEIDILLELFAQILHKEEDKCICSNEIPMTDHKNSFYETEIIPNIKVELTEDRKIKFSEIILKLKQCGFPLTGAMLSIYIPDMEDYILIGSDPVDSGIMLDENVFKSKFLKIRAICFIEEKYVAQNLVKINDKLIQSLGLEKKLSKQQSNLDKKNSKRTKERKIGYIIEKVNTWRKLYNGFQDENGKFTKYSLDEAAKIIGISKKSLDDYLLQLRLGRRFGFDFNSNKNTKVGILRSFVKKYKNSKVNDIC